MAVRNLPAPGGKRRGLPARFFEKGVGKSSSTFSAPAIILKPGNKVQKMFRPRSIFVPLGKGYAFSRSAADALSPRDSPAGSEKPALPADAGWR
jgi:hypothetical protein